MDRNELLQLYETHVLPKPQRNVFKCIKNAKITNISSDVPSSTTNYKRVDFPCKRNHSPAEKTTGGFERSKINSAKYIKKNRIDLMSSGLKRSVHENNESIEEYLKKRRENYPNKSQKPEDEKSLIKDEETINGEPSSPSKKKFKRIEFP